MRAGAIGLRLVRETSPRTLWKFLWNCGFKGVRAVQRFERRARQGRHFPAFVFISPTNRCNLACQGCWVQQTTPPVDLPQAVFRRIIDAARAEGSSFFGILGGEPLLYPGLFDVIGDYPDCYFQLFTNGTLLTRETAAAMRRLGNVTPLISVEGLERVSDERRGGRGVYASAMQAVAHCRAERLVTGVATSVCRSNIDELVSTEFLDGLVAAGVHYAWYYIYRPCGANPCRELALPDEDILRLRRFIVEQRARSRLALVDAYWDAEGRALCPAVTGISHHINPYGDVEVCPPIQFATDRIDERTDVRELFDRSTLLREFRRDVAARTRGCILLEAPGELARILAAAGARNVSGRVDELGALAGAPVLPSHHMAGREIPERSVLVRFAKRHWFFGFGAYG